MYIKPENPTSNLDYKSSAQLTEVSAWENLESMQNLHSHQIKWLKLKQL